MMSMIFLAFMLFSTEVVKAQSLPLDEDPSGILPFIFPASAILFAVPDGML